MKNNAVKWIITAVLLVAIIAGAGVLYKNLSKDYAGGNLAQTSQTENKSTAENESSKENNSQDEKDYTAPDFVVYNEKGEKVKLSDFKGKPVVLNFWATWCYYCKEEMPDFDKAFEKYPDVQFLMVNVTDNVQETVESAKEFVQKKGYKFDVFFDTEQSATSAYYVSGLPATFFIDKDGQLVTRASGMLDYNSLERGIKMIAQ